MNKEYYNKVYIPDIVKWGKITMLLGIITCFWTGTCYLSCVRMYATGIRNHCRYNRTDQCKWSIFIL